MDFSTIDWPEALKGLFALLGLFGVGGASVYGVRTQYRKVKAVDNEMASDAVKEEWKELALAREKKIEDLEKQVSNLEDRVAHLEGQLEAVLSLKETRIADRVAELLHVAGYVRGDHEL